MMIYDYLRYTGRYDSRYDGIYDSNLWILGANYNETSRIDVKDDVNCGASSCYEESVENGQICKPGRLCF